MKKKKWIHGPELDKSYRYVKSKPSLIKTKTIEVPFRLMKLLSACSLTLNSSTVLFIGLSNSSDPELYPKAQTIYNFDKFAWSNVKNDIVASYNFDHKSWVQHESLNPPSFGISGSKTVDLHYGYEILCSCYHGKNASW